MRPAKICLILWIVIALLAGVCLVVPADGWHIGTLNLKWPTLAKALDLQQDTIITQDSVLIADIIAEETEIDEDAAPAPITEKPAAPVATIPPVPTPDTPAINPRHYLRAFYEALPTARNRQVRVVHYGDSQIEEDRITMVLRERLQTAYGGGGVGLIPLHQTIPTRSLHQSLEMNGTFQTTQGGPQRYLVYGPKSMRLTTGDYGVMGQVAVMNDSLCAGSENLRLVTEPMDNGHTYNYFGQIRLLARGIDAQARPLRGGTYTLFNKGIAILPDSITRCEVRLQGKGMVYGLSLETPTGIIVDNIPMRGSSGTVFTQIQRNELTGFFEDTNTRLIIMQYGGNMIPQTQNPSTISGYVKSLRRQVECLRQCAPDAAILFIGPSDMSKRIDGEMTTNPLIPYLDRLLARMAHDEHIGYWSIYQAMGGHNSMLSWQQRGLAGRDYIHFTRRGADKIGGMLADWLLEIPDFQPVTPVDTITTNPDTTTIIPADAIQFPLLEGAGGVGSAALP